MRGLNSGVYGNGSALPPRLEQLIARTGRGYANGGPVPQAGMGQPPMPQPQAAPAANMGGDQLQGVVQQTLAQNPQVMQQLQQAIQQAIDSGEATPQELNLIAETAKAVTQNPALYPRLRQMLIENGIATEQEMPPQYDQGLVFALLLIAQAVEGNPAMAAPPGGAQPRMADGGSIPQSASPNNDKSGRADDIGIRVSGGEYVIPKHIVAAKGTEFFDRMLEQYDPNNPESKVNQK